ncbi:MAG: PilZ domain-containing protein [Polyangiaceae bacterium]|nr:PilZ domain-containing protein [Polyangiaceae bacterium]
MSNEEERRAGGMQRVPVQALVEICGRDVGGAPAFEAESIDVSGRGMQLRTAYLPEVGAPLVCRFDNAGQEVVVEGVVAWRREEGRGGEFGIKFTALDSGSVEVLKELCGMQAKATVESAPAAASAAESQAPAGAGLRVRLHIDGLGSPMKACVRGGSSKQVQVASNLEFLKVGRHLEIEDVGAGERRGAQIDGVDVLIDPQTRVPQLVVALRYDGATDDTPEPSVIDSEDRMHGADAEIGGFSAAAASTDDDGPMGDDDFVDGAEMSEEAAQMRGKVANMAVEAGTAAKKGGALFAKLSGAAALGVGKFFKGAGAKMMDLKHKRQGDAPRRTTAAAPVSQLGRKLRPQSGAVAEAEPTETLVDPAAKKRRVKKIAAASALGVLLLTVGVVAMKKPAAPPGAEKDPAASIAVAAKPNDVTVVDEQGNPVADKKPADKLAAPGESGTTADVPLFGPTPMATMEPAPLGAAPSADEDGADEPDPKGDEAKEKAAASAAVDDETFGGSDDKAAAGATSWGHGTLNEPVVHRLRLDKAGTAIQGAVNATGFTVVLPGVKVMESADGIMKRDERIARVKTKNGTSGAEVSFQFKDGIPGYKVRLKKDSVEFLISAGKSGAATATPSSTGGTKKASKKTANAKKASAAKKASKGGKADKATAKKKTKKKAG